MNFRQGSSCGTLWNGDDMKKTTEKTNMRLVRYTAGILALVWMCVIFAFSAQTKEESSAVSESLSYRMVSSTGHFFHWNLDEEQLREIANTIEYFVRKAAHMTEFAIMSILLFVWLGLWEMTLFRRGMTAFLATAVYAASDEFHQLFVPGRAGRVSDVLLDSSGALLGVIFFILLGKLFVVLRDRRRKKRQAKG